MLVVDFEKEFLLTTKQYVLDSMMMWTYRFYVQGHLRIYESKSVSKTKVNFKKQKVQR